MTGDIALPQQSTRSGFLFFRDPRARRILLAVLALVPIITPWVAPTDDGDFIYPYTAFVILVSIVFCVAAARQDAAARLRWHLVALSQFAFSARYFSAVVYRLHWISNPTSYWASNVSLAVAITLFLPAVISSHEVRIRRLLTFDSALMLLACVLLVLSLQYGIDLERGATRLVIGLLAEVLVAVAAQTAAIANNRPGLRRFMVAVTVYLWASVLTTFLVNIVDYVMLHHVNSLVADLLIPFSHLFLCEWSMHEHPRWEPRRRSARGLIVLENLQPSLLAIGSAVMALFALRQLPFWEASVVIVAMLLYALRTQIFYLGLFREQTALRSRATRLEELATRDPLTGIGNRRWFEQNTEQLLIRSSDKTLSLMLIDVDHFKQVNDTFGHYVGDSVLVLVADALKHITAHIPGACVARIGGDEFAALLPGVSAEQARTAAGILRERIASAEHFRVKLDSAVLDTLVSASVSVGMASVAHMNVMLPTLLRWADAALYRAKNDGRNCVREIDLTVDGINEDELEGLPHIGRD